MLKNKLKALFIILMIISLAFSPLVFAEDEDANVTDIISEENGEIVEEENTEIVEEEDVNSADEEITETTVDENAEINSNEPEESNTDEYLNNMKEEDVYLVGDEITIDYIVDGNLFVIANKVNVDSQIVGNAFICAKEVNITLQGYISNSLFVSSNKLTLDGVAYDVYATCENIKLTGYVYRDFKSISSELNIWGTIGRNATVSAKNISFIDTSNNDTNTNNDETNDETNNVANTTSTEQNDVSNIDNANEDELLYTNAQGKIMGNLNYSSSKEINIPDSTVDGEVKFEQGNWGINFGSYIVSLLSYLLLVLVIWLLLKWFAPKFVEKSNELLTTKIGSSIGFGLLSFIAIPLISAALFFIGFTKPIALLLLLAYIVLVVLGINVFTIALSNIVCNKFKISKNLQKIGILLVISLVLWLLTIIPYAGIIISIIYIILGLGIITKNLISKE